MEILKMSQSELKTRLLKLIDNEGTSQKFIAKQTKISETMISLFKNDKAKLGLIERESLDRYLTSRGY